MLLAWLLACVRVCSVVEQGVCGRVVTCRRGVR
eukprot:COSAG06_NODE_66390_length_254_cov_0.993548_1_plen_32_part_01